MIVQRALPALRWAALAKFASQGLSWLLTLVVIRLLAPSDYGLMASAMVVIELAGLLAELGLSAVLIQAPAVTVGLARQVFGLVLLTHAVWLGTLWMAAPWLAQAFGEEQLAVLLAVLATQLMIEAPAVVPQALLKRELRFKPLALRELSATAAGAVTVFGLALLGYGVWALAVGALVNNAVSTAVVLALSDFRSPPTLRFAGLGHALGKGMRFSAQGTLAYFNRKADVVIVGLLLGQETLGVYVVAVDLAKVPLRTLLRVIDSVIFPAYARLQDDLRQVEHYFLRSVELSALVFFPLLWGLAVVAEEAVLVLFGAKWQGAIVPVQIVSLALPLWSITRLLGPLLNGLGRLDIALENLLTTSVGLPLAVSIGCQWGLLGAAWGLSVAYILISLFNIERTVIVLQGSLAAFLRALTPALLSASVMYLGVWLALRYWLTEYGLVGRLILASAYGALLYGLMTLLLNRAALLRALRLVYRY